ncbi:MAG: Sec-independent protein translocase subunit TatA/TatB [Egibacteraceae bacterium]
MNLQIGEMAFLGMLALLIFGPERLPGMARNLGRMVARFRSEASGALDELKQTAELDDLRGAVNELRGQTQGLRQVVTLAAPQAAAAAAVETPVATRENGHGPALRPGETAPFDPDAT